MQVGNSWTSYCKRALAVVFPPSCGVCLAIGPEEFCPNCLDKLQICAQPPLELIVPFLYEGTAGRAVKALKYRRRTCLAPLMSAQMAKSCEHVLPRIDRILPVPIHWRRRFSRGFNQAELLAIAFPPEKISQILRRVRYTRPQVKLSREERLGNLDRAFEVPPEVMSEVQGKRILLIDDVVTTGATLRAVAHALYLNGAISVEAACYALEPGPEIVRLKPGM